MKKFLTVLCALLLVPTLATANSNMVSISELRQQVKLWDGGHKTIQSIGK